jgi:hypothetical protein
VEELALHIDDGVSEGNLQVGHEGRDGDHRRRSEGVIPGPELDAIIGLITRYCLWSHDGLRRRDCLQGSGELKAPFIL